MKKILVIGCSNGLGMHHAFRQVFQNTQSNAKTYTPYQDKNKWPDEILEDDYCKYINLSMAGAGNSYIRHRLIEYLQDDIPDYVYLQFSGLVRRDICFDIDSLDLFLQEKDSDNFKITNKKIYVVGGNFSLSGSKISLLQKLFCLLYNKRDFNSNNENSLAEIFCCINMLEAYKIKHNWCFYYDPCKIPTTVTYEEGTLKTLPKYINQENMLPSPLNFAIENKFDVNDGVHYGYDPFVKFLQFQKDSIHLNINDK